MKIMSIENEMELNGNEMNIRNKIVGILKNEISKLKKQNKR